MLIFFFVSMKGVLRMDEFNKNEKKISDWFDALNDKLDEIDEVREINATNKTIVSLTSHEFTERWHKYAVKVPVNFVNFPEVYKSLLEYHPEAIGDTTKLCVDNEIMRRWLGELSLPMVDYINTFRLVNITQALTTFSHYELVDLEVSPDGKMIYVVTEKAEDEAYGEYYETVVHAVKYYNQSV